MVLTYWPPVVPQKRKRPPPKVIALPNQHSQPQLLINCPACHTSVHNDLFCSHCFYKLYTNTTANTSIPTMVNSNTSATNMSSSSNSNNSNINYQQQAVHGASMTAPVVGGGYGSGINQQV
jgi:hypothetical protein